MASYSKVNGMIQSIPILSEMQDLRHRRCGDGCGGKLKKRHGNPKRLQQKAYGKRLMGSKINLIVQFLPILVKFKEDAYIHVKENAYIHFQNAGTSFFEV